MLHAVAVRRHGADDDADNDTRDAYDQEGERDGAGNELQGKALYRLFGDSIFPVIHKVDIVGI